MNTLEKICAAKRTHIAARKKKISESDLQGLMETQTAPRGFHLALKRKLAGNRIGLIAEVKKASPSKGVIREDFDPPSLAAAYEKGGAACVSVLTDEEYFQGQDEYLAAARKAVQLPVLRKDFMLDPYQVLEARALGADCILLIMAALSDTQANELESAAAGLGMDILVEVHDGKELERALSVLYSRLIGINNRNLKTLEIDLNITKQLVPRIPKDYTIVCESGISKQSEIRMMRTLGVHCFLIGESLMRAKDVAEATRRVLDSGM